MSTFNMYDTNLNQLYLYGKYIVHNTELNAVLTVQAVS